MNHARLKVLLFDLRQILEELEKEVRVSSGLLTEEDIKKLNEGLKERACLRGPVNAPYPNDRQWIVKNGQLIRAEIPVPLTDDGDVN